MIDKLRQEITEFLQQHQVGHLALSAPDGPWASVVRFMSAGLTLYLIEPRASDLVFYVENDPHIVLTIDEPGADPEDRPQKSIQLFGSARILAPHELPPGLAEIQAAWRLKNQQSPGVYVMIELKPKRIYRLVHHNQAIHQDTIDIEGDSVA